MNGVGEVYAGLLELSATASLAGVGTDALDDVSRVNESLDALRGAFDELERDDRQPIVVEIGIARGPGADSRL